MEEHLPDALGDAEAMGLGCAVEQVGPTVPREVGAAVHREARLSVGVDASHHGDVGGVEIAGERAGEQPHSATTGVAMRHADDEVGEPVTRHVAAGLKPLADIAGLLCSDGGQGVVAAHRAGDLGVEDAHCAHTRGPGSGDDQVGRTVAGEVCARAHPQANEGVGLDGSGVGAGRQGAVVAAAACGQQGGTQGEGRGPARTVHRRASYLGAPTAGFVVSVLVVNFLFAKVCWTA